jgi:TatA/E family protein of Tat protein translocase
VFSHWSFSGASEISTTSRDNLERKTGEPMIGSVPDIAVVVLVGFVLFGAKNIPQIGKNLGRGLRELKEDVSELKDDLDISN